MYSFFIYQKLLNNDNQTLNFHKYWPEYKDEETLGERETLECSRKLFNEMGSPSKQNTPTK